MVAAGRMTEATLQERQQAQRSSLWQALNLRQEARNSSLRPAQWTQTALQLDRMCYFTNVLLHQ